MHSSQQYTHTQSLRYGECDVAHVVDAADDLGTVLFGYARCSHVAADRYSHSSRTIDMDGRGSPLITADKPNSLTFVDVLHH